MEDNANLRGGPDRRINADQDEIHYLHQQFPQFSREEIVRAIREKGPSRAGVIAYLQEKVKSGEAQE